MPMEDVSLVMLTVLVAALVQMTELVMVRANLVMLSSTILLVHSALVHTANVPKHSIQDLSETDNLRRVTL